MISHIGSAAFKTWDLNALRNPFLQDYLDLLWAAPRHDGGSKICNYRLEQFVVSGPVISSNTLTHHPVYHLSRYAD